jgi:chromate transporter
LARGSALEVLAVTLRLGLTSFGGPVAHIGYQRDAFVTRHRWLDEHTFGELVALCQTLPGPASSQLTVAVGRLRAGWAGAVAAWVGFTLPSAVVMTLVGLGVAAGGLPATGPAAGAIAGLKVVAVAVVAQAVVSMARQLTPDAPRILMAAVAAGCALVAPTPLTQLLLIAVAALVGGVALPRSAGRTRPTDDARPTDRDDDDPPATGGRRTAIALAAAFVLVVLGSQAIALATGNPGAGLVAALVRAGALVFGGGHVVLPLLDAGVVAPGWVSPDAFLAGYGVAQAVPGPLFTFAAYLGAAASAGPGGVAGAALATAAIFVPGTLLVLAALPALAAMRRRPGLRSALDGVNAAVVGILAAALVDPDGTGGITSPLAAGVALAGGALLVTGRVPPIAVVAASAVAMAVAAA